MSNVTNFPIWKQNSSAVEKMREALQYMESRQEDMQNVIIIYHDEEGAMQWLTDATMTVAFAIGVIELAKYELMKYKGE